MKDHLVLEERFVLIFSSRMCVLVDSILVYTCILVMSSGDRKSVV